MDILWDWANAYALTGQPIPQDLPLMIRSVRGRQESGYPGPTSRVLKLIDFYIWELTLQGRGPHSLSTPKCFGTTKLLNNFRIHEVVANHVADDHVTVFDAAHVEIIDVDVELDQRAELAPILAGKPDRVAAD